MPAVNLPLLPGDTIYISAQVPGLELFLAPINDPEVAARIGQERIAFQCADLILTEGEKFGSKLSWTQGRRYIRLDPATQEPIAALNVSIKQTGRKKEVVASNIYTHPDYRRQGIGSGLLLRAQEDFPNLAASGTLSELGAELVGKSTMQPTPSSPRM